MYKYKNISNTEQHLVGFGVVEAGGEIVVNTAVENPNFKYVGAVEDEAKITGITERSENAVTEAEKVEPTEGVQ